MNKNKYILSVYSANKGEEIFLSFVTHPTIGDGWHEKDEE